MPATPTTTPTPTAPGDLITELGRVPERFERAPELVGTFTVLLVENIAPDAPLHDRLHKRYRDAVDIISRLIERGQRRGPYRTDFDAAIKAVGDSRLHQRNGDLMVARSFNPADRGVQGVRGVAGAGPDGDAAAAARHEVPPRRRVAPTVLDAVRFAGGWIYDRVMAGWDVTVLVGGDEDCRPLEILGAEAAGSGIGAGVVGGAAAPADGRGRRGPVRPRRPGAPGRAGRARPGRDRGDAVGRAPARPSSTAASTPSSTGSARPHGRSRLRRSRRRIVAASRPSARPRRSAAA